MACPDCRSSSGNLRFATSVETHGLDCGPYERFNDEFIVCRECGGRFDVGDWQETSEEAPSSREERNGAGFSGLPGSPGPILRDALTRRPARMSAAGPPLGAGPLRRLETGRLE
jgi:hypothetical protein